MTDTPAPEGTTLPESPVGMRQRPSDVVAHTPVVKGPSAEGPAGAATVPARPGTPAADTPALAVERATRVDEIQAQANEPRILTTDQIMPTCMIYAMFLVLALLVGTLVLWGLSTPAFGHLLHGG